MSVDSFKLISNGLFTSLLIYCIHVYGNVWGIQENDETNRRYSSFTKADCQKLQVLQNKMLKLQTGLPRDFSTCDLMKETQELSVHQLIAYYTLLQVHKTIVNKKPSYISEKFALRNSKEGVVLPHRQFSTITPVKKKLNLSRAGFIFRGTELFNMLPMELRICKQYQHFKAEVRKWTQSNISIKPT